MKHDTHKTKTATCNTYGHKRQSLIAGLYDGCGTGEYIMTLQ